jgi:hypothetical protein
VATQLLDVAHRTEQNASALERPIWWVRIVDLLLIGVIVTVLVVGVARTQLPRMELDLAQAIMLVESGLNDLVLIGAALFFLYTLENRVKRQRALADLHELRSLAHVIDMHQLTKDPDRTLLTRQPTASSPERTLTAYELSRYLDYCSELLSLVGKLAALYVQHLNDSVVQQSVDEIESLTTGLSQKIWQKVMILYEMAPEELGIPGDSTPAPALPGDQATGGMRVDLTSSVLPRAQKGDDEE